jgi:hypothetical protein
MIDYKDGFFIGQVYTTTNTSPVENFKNGWKYDMVANMATLFVRGVLQRSSLLGNIKPLDKKLGLRKLQLEGFYFLFFPILSTISTVASNDLVLSMNSWPTGALFTLNMIFVKTSHDT